MIVPLQSPWVVTLIAVSFKPAAYEVDSREQYHVESSFSAGTYPAGAPPSLRTEDLEPHATTTLIAREKRSKGNWGRSWVGTRLRVALALVSFPAVDFLRSGLKKNQASTEELHSL